MFYFDVTKLKSTMNITKNFTFEEFEQSETALKFGIDNRMESEEIRANVKALCVNVLQPLRDKFGEIEITSGYRCSELNAKVGGKPNSQHLKGEAADIAPRKTTLKELLTFIREKLQFDQCYLEKNGDVQWIHISYSRIKNRRVLGTINVQNGK